MVRKKNSIWQGYGNAEISLHYSFYFFFAYPPEFSCSCKFSLHSCPWEYAIFLKPSSHHSTTVWSGISSLSNVHKPLAATGRLFSLFYSSRIFSSSTSYPVVFFPWNQSNKGIHSSEMAREWVGGVHLPHSYIGTPAHAHTYYISSAIACMYTPSRAIFFSSNDPGTVALATDTFYCNSLIRFSLHKHYASVWISYGLAQIK